jgi:hypothetical protein
MFAAYRIRVSAIVVSIGMVALAVYGQTAGWRRVPTSLDVNAPEHWVPFEADVRITYPASVEVVGRFYRSSDGSVRLETGPSRDDVRVIFIRNVPEAVVYGWSGGSWRKEPLVMPQFWVSPPRWRITQHWSRYPYRLAIRLGESGDIAASDGFTAYRVLGPAGITKLKVPELNMFDAVIDRPDGRHETYVNVRIGEQPDWIFKPPVSAVVARRPIRPTGD